MMQSFIFHVKDKLLRFSTWASKPLSGVSTAVNWALNQYLKYNFHQRLLIGSLCGISKKNETRRNKNSIIFSWVSLNFEHQIYDSRRCSCQLNDQNILIGQHVKVHVQSKKTIRRQLGAAEIYLRFHFCTTYVYVYLFRKKVVIFEFGLIHYVR